MEFAKNFTRVSALALGITAALAYGDVHAAAFQLKENSVKAQGRAMAGAASAKGDASVVANNPAEAASPSGDNLKEMRQWFSNLMVDSFA